MPIPDTESEPKKSPNFSLKSIGFLFSRGARDFLPSLAVLLHNNNKKPRHNHHHKETHGWRDDMDVNKSMSDVKAPNLFERAKEEIEAIVGTIHCRKGSKDSDMPILGKTRGADRNDPLETDKSELHSVP
ncbi:hypothetical protein OROGR_006205 [Orobanche gracilis]